MTASCFWLMLSASGVVVQQVSSSSGTLLGGLCISIMSCHLATSPVLSMPLLPVFPCNITYRKGCAACLQQKARLNQRVMTNAFGAHGPDLQSQIQCSNHWPIRQHLTHLLSCSPSLPVSSSEHMWCYAYIFSKSLCLTLQGGCRNCNGQLADSCWVLGAANAAPYPELLESVGRAEASDSPCSLGVIAVRPGPSFSLVAPCRAASA